MENSSKASKTLGRILCSVQDFQDNYLGILTINPILIIIAVYYYFRTAIVVRDLVDVWALKKLK